MTVGLTRDSGWQVGVSRIIDCSVDRVWTALVESPEIWLGHGARLPSEPGKPWAASDGTCGELRSWHHHDRVRLTLRRPGDPSDSTVQVTVRPAGSRTTVRFHQERMRDAEQRAARRPALR